MILYAAVSAATAGALLAANGPHRRRILAALFLLLIWLGIRW